MEYIDYYKDSQLLYNHNKDNPPFFHNYGMHAHDIYELHYLISGEGTFTIEGTTYPLTNNSIYLVRPNEAHYTKLNNTAPYERICLHFYPEAITMLDPAQQLLAPFNLHKLGENNYFPLSEAQQIIVNNAFSNISLYATEDTYTKKLSLTISLLSILAELSKLQQEEKHQSKNTQKNSLIGEVLTYINSHLYEEIKIQDLCNQFYISRSHLHSTFKECTHTTIGNYILMKRMNAAKAMLKNNIPAKEIAYILGYHDYSAFYRAYKKHFHVSPNSK